MDEGPQREAVTSVYSLDRYSNDVHKTSKHDKESIEYALENEVEI